ncbi:MAG: hypothetical protein Q7R44_01025 [bacterium]|nr:hypothetical protein [bacterium]
MSGEPSGDTSKPIPREIGRRGFLKGLLATLAVGAASSIPPLKQDTRKLFEIRSRSTHIDKVRDYWRNKNSKTSVEKKEIAQFEPMVTIVDAAPTTPVKGIIQEGSVDNDKLIQELMGDKFISREQLKNEFGEDYSSHWMNVIEKYPEAGVMYLFFDAYFGHGQNVAKVMEKTWEREGLQSKGIRLKALQNIMDATSKTLVTDELGNQGIAINFDPQRIIALLKNDPNRVVNFSFQIGDVGLIPRKWVKEIPEVGVPSIEYEKDSEGNEINKETLYFPPQGGYITISGSSHSKGSYGIPLVDGKEMPSISKQEYNNMMLKKRKEAEEKATVKEINELLPSIVGAYDVAKAERNLPKLFEVCRAYPEKLFVVAGGNGKEDIRGTLEKLKDQRPKNLLIVAEWDRYLMLPAAGMQGADIYVYNDGLDTPNESTFSTTVITAYAEILFRKRLSMDQVIEKVKYSCTSVNYSLIGLIDENEALVFDKQSIAKLKDNSVSS